MKFIDIGLSSKTLWAESNIVNTTMSMLPKEDIPTLEQFEELFRECKRKLCTDADGKDFLVFIGPNGKRLSFALNGYMTPVINKDVKTKDYDCTDFAREYAPHFNDVGYYRTSSVKDFHGVIIKMYNNCSVEVHLGENTNRYCVRQVKTKTRNVSRKTKKDKENLE